ncbi:glycosyltransferase family A protein [Chitinophaga sp.]|uniref:glycosyltransferase family 2 protein n=1 Tax=Chitinophaga sp. TaxID=1869181 RepID=UPI002B7B39C1|nr:glycosyltransferase family A protein [Chitinophaga sp.]HWV64269.1 glycosyltransferase family A protein [Chitinophaga sp.]
MSSSNPLISCICVTHRKPALLARAVRCFAAQTYQHKELVILFEDNDLSTLAFLAEMQPEDNIKLICIQGEPKKTLGELRNLAVRAATGEFICQWDDDDWYHMERLEYQHQVICETKVSGCLLTRWLVYDSSSGRAFLSNRRRWEGSIMCRKEVFTGRKYEHKVRGEDTDIIEYLHENNHLVYIDDRPDLYVYIYHGNNTWGVDHFSKIFEKSMELAGYSSLIANILDSEYSPEECRAFINSMELGLHE